MAPIEIVYLNKENKNKINIFNKDFVKKYKDSFKIIYMKKEYPLCEYLLVNEKTTEIRIKLISKENILLPFNEMFKGCDLLYKFYEIPTNEKNSNNRDKYLCYEILKLVYKIKPFDNKIKIFGENFVNNNKNKCFIKYSEEIFPLKEFFHINHFASIIDNYLEIFLLVFEEITDKSYLFHNCYSLEEVITFKEIKEQINNFSEINLLDYDSENNKIKIPTEEKFVLENGIKVYKNQKDKYKYNSCTNMSFMFYGCSSLIYLSDISEWYTNEVTDISYMFYDCSSLISIPDISTWNVDKVNNMEHLFSGCLSLKSLPDLSKWNISNVNNLSYMFFECSSLISLPDISKWNTNNVKDISFMFCYCSSLNYLPDISNWKIEQVIDMSFMFYGCSLLNSLPDLIKWNINEKTDKSFMFDNCTCTLLKYLPINNNNENNILENNIMFSDLPSFSLIYKRESKENILKIFGEKFINNYREKYIIKYKNNIFPLQAFFLPHENEEKEEKIEIIFIELDSKYFKKYFCYLNKLNKGLLQPEEKNNLITNKSEEIFDSGQDRKKFEDFYDNSGINAIEDLSTINNKMDHPNKKPLLELYKSLPSLKNKSKKIFSHCNNMSYMFYECSSLISIKNISEWDTRKVIDMSLMFYGCSSLISLPDLTKWNVSNVNNLYGSFSGCSSLKSLPGLSKWKPKNLLYISHLFDSCSSLTYIPDISKWNIINITDMSSIFRRCSNLIFLPDISKWNTKNTENMSEMFRECSSLISLPDISKWDISKLNDITKIFYKCKSLISMPNISKWKNILYNKDYMFYKCLSLISLPDISEWKYFSSTANNNIFEDCFLVLNLPDDYL